MHNACRGCKEMEKIISVDKQEGRKPRWNLYIVHFENENGEKYDAHMFEEEYNVLIFKKYLLDMGISEIDLDKYEKLLHDHWDRE